jgi:putative endonuclease
MADHIELGKEGEDLAVDWLLKNGFTIVDRNWTHGKLEIDIIARKDNRLHIIEVKCRHYNSFSHPEESVGKKKFRSLQRAADEYLFQNPGNEWMQYSIVAIKKIKNREPEFFFIEDVYL